MNKPSWKGLFIVIGALLYISIMLIALEFSSWDRKELKAFNKINNTEYSIEEWRIYSYEIKKLYPLKETPNE